MNFGKNYLRITLNFILSFKIILWSIFTRTIPYNPLQALNSSIQNFTTISDSQILEYFPFLQKSTKFTILF